MFANVDQLEEFLSRPSAEDVQAVQSLDGDILILGAAGKMGPTLARMARRHLIERAVLAASSALPAFSDSHQRAALEACGVETIRCDLLDEAEVDRLPDADNVVFMAGRKFGSTGSER